MPPSPAWHSPSPAAPSKRACAQLTSHSPFPGRCLCPPATQAEEAARAAEDGRKSAREAAAASARATEAERAAGERLTATKGALARADKAEKAIKAAERRVALLRLRSPARPWGSPCPALSCLPRCSGQGLRAPGCLLARCSMQSGRARFVDAG